MKNLDVNKLMKKFDIEDDYDKIRYDFIFSKREENLKKLLEERGKIQEAYSNAGRIMAMDKQRREGKN